MGTADASQLAYGLITKIRLSNNPHQWIRLFTNQVWIITYTDYLYSHHKQQVSCLHIASTHTSSCMLCQRIIPVTPHRYKTSIRHQPMAECSVSWPSMSVRPDPPRAIKELIIANCSLLRLISNAYEHHVTRNLTFNVVDTVVLCC